MIKISNFLEECVLKLKNNSIFNAYTDLVNLNNCFLTLISLILGSVSFYFIGYYLQAVIKNQFVSSNLISLIFLGISLDIILWVIKSFFEYYFYNTMKTFKEKNKSIIFFFTVEGMSNMSYILILPFYLLFNGMFFSYWIIGLGILLKYLFIYISIKELCEKKSNTIPILITLSSVSISLIFYFLLGGFF